MPDQDALGGRGTAFLRIGYEQPRLLDSLRASIATRLAHTGVPPVVIMELTGTRS